MTIRTATLEDAGAFREIWEEFHQAPPWVRETWETIWPYAERSFADGLAILAEEDRRTVGFVLGEIDARDPALGRLVDLYVRPEARRRGLARGMIARAAARLRELGAVRIAVEVGLEDGPARSLYDRMGFGPHTLNLAAEAASVENAAIERAEGPSFGSIQIQTDDQGAVERAVQQFIPRLPGRSLGSRVEPPRNGWTGVYDELCDREPELLRRLARELSDRLGAVVIALGVERGAVVRFVLLERGRVMDEYLSVPEYYGPLPPGDVVALRANPTVIGRLTGADPARVRAAARTAASTADLPPAAELLAQVAGALGIDGARPGYVDR